MNKSVENIQSEPEVALTAWSDMTGVQIKALASYHTAGADFDEAVAWVATHNPARVVKGLIILTPTEVFDISPGGAFNHDDLSL